MQLMIQMQSNIFYTQTPSSSHERLAIKPQSAVGWGGIAQALCDTFSLCF